MNPAYHEYLPNVKSAQDPTLGATVETKMSKGQGFCVRQSKEIFQFKITLIKYDRATKYKSREKMAVYKTGKRGQCSSWFLKDGH